MVDISDFFSKKKSAAPAKPAAKPRIKSAVRQDQLENKENESPRKSKRISAQPKKEIIDLFSSDDDEDEDILLLSEKGGSSQSQKPSAKDSSKSGRSASKKSNKSPSKISKSSPQKKKPVSSAANKALVHSETPSTKTEPANGPTSFKKTYANVHELLEDIPSIDLENVTTKQVSKQDFFANKNSDGGASEHESHVDDFPQGKPNCLLGLTIVFTGVLPTLERGEAEGVAKKYGAKVTKAISRKTSLVVLGEEAGPKKVATIKDYNIKAISEDGFKQLIAGMPSEGGDSVEAEKAKEKIKKEEQQLQKDLIALETQMKNDEAERNKKNFLNNESASGERAPRNFNTKPSVNEDELLWTVKYAPKKITDICGNKTVVNRLKTWLENWQQYAKDDFKKPGPQNLGTFRAAMVSGPPGIGKTTAAHIIANELGYDVLEKNASDVRSKNLLNEKVKGALNNTSVIGFFKHSHEDHQQNQNKKKFVIIMDEVDGMSGGDRGGVGQLTSFIRKTRTPMILICNERYLPKMRPFDRICLELPFRRPDANAIKARLMTIAFREKFKLDSTVIENLATATRGDMRQIINLLSTVSSTTKDITHDNIKQITVNWEKEVALKPFDITAQLLRGNIYTDLGCERFPLYKKMELYFDDIDFTPLMIQENYINTQPTNLPPGMSRLQAVANAAESLSLGDLVDRKIRSSEQLWSLLPFHAIMSSVLPASQVAGNTGRINFTAWLGQNSSTGKFNRLLQELFYRSRLSTSTDKLGFRTEYMPALKKHLLDPIVNKKVEGVPEVIELLDAYYLSKDDWDVIMSFFIGPQKTADEIKKIPTAVKSAFTRQYNSTTHPVSIYTTASSTGVSAGSGKQSKPDSEDVVDQEDEAVPDDEDKETDSSVDLKKDKLIKANAKPKKRGASKKPAGGAAKKRKTASK
ncbi:replication factor C subunit 1 [Hanseniaspora vineae]